MVSVSANYFRSVAAATKMLQSKQARDFDFDSGLLKQLLIRAIYLPLSYGKLEIKSIVKEEFKNDWYFYSIQKIVRKMSQNS